MGAWEGRTWAELSEADGAAVTAYWDDYVNARPTGGESWREAAARVVRTWEALGALEGRLVVCTHVGPIRALLCHWLGLGPEQGLRFAPAYGTETRVLLADAGAVVERIGA
jgi:alpha-ribazole phosphatase